jgi:hypothetical protein
VPSLLPFLLPDWRDAEAYAPLLEAERSAFAWEWLRRNERYARAARAPPLARSRSATAVVDAQPRAREWHLHAFEDPALAAAAARPVWRAEVHRFVLAAEAERSAPGPDALDPDRLRRLLTLVRGSGCTEHLLLSDGRRSIRVDVHGASLLEGPVRLRCRLEGLEQAQAPLLVLRRLLALARSGRFSTALQPADVRAGRLVLMLRAHDASAAGATQREIAGELLSLGASVRRWRVDAPTLRSRAQRLVRSAGAMAAGAYLTLL